MRCAMLVDAIFQYRANCSVSDPFSPQASKQKPPGSLQELQRRLTRYANAEGLNPGRVQQRICTEVVLATLERAQRAGVVQMYLAKGGMALEIRFGVLARASGDLDIGIVARGDELIAVFDRVLAVGFDDFTLTRPAEPHFLDRVSTYRLTVKIQYKGRPFGSLDVDLNEASHETAVTIERTGLLTALGLPGPISVPLLDPLIQLTHKIHGATEPSRADYKNNRHRDILDVLIIARDLPNLDISRLRRALIDEFARRPYHTVWPPMRLELPDGWHDALARDAIDNDFAPADGVAIWREFVTFLVKIEGFMSSPLCEYRFLNLTEKISGGGTLHEASQSEFDALIVDGWRVVFIAHHRHYVDQIQAILERTLATFDKLPRLQLRARAENAPGQPTMLLGELRNDSDHPANDVRVTMTGVEGQLRFGTVTRGDGPLPIMIAYGNQRASAESLQFPAITVEYLTDDGRPVRQICELEVYGPNANRRFDYTAKGLKPPEIVARLSATAV